jgi:hypothetical protein
VCIRLDDVFHEVDESLSVHCGRHAAGIKPTVNHALAQVLHMLLESLEYEYEIRLTRNP